jgi:hypothetical protein
MTVENDSAALIYRYAGIPMPIAAYLLVYVSVLFGVVWMGNHGPQFISLDPVTPVSTFGGILKDMTEVGGVAEVIGSIMYVVGLVLCQ